MPHIMRTDRNTQKKNYIYLFTQEPHPAIPKVEFMKIKKNC